MLIKKLQTTKEQFGKNGTVWDYPMPNEKVGISVQEINGRVPESGWGRNKVCYEVCYVLEGMADVFIENKNFKVDEGDVFIVNPQEKSYIVGRNLKILTATFPNWYKEQCEIVDN